MRPPTTCPGCGLEPATHATARDGLRLCARCFAEMVRAIREGRP